MGLLARSMTTAGVCALIWSGCAAKKATEVVPGVMTQIQIPRNMKGIRIDILTAGQPSVSQVYKVDPAQPGFITTWGDNSLGNPDVMADKFD